MSGSKEDPLGTCFMMRSLYATAKAAVVTGGTKFGMQMALEKVRAAKGTVVAKAAPSLRWWCQSSGLARVSVWSCSAMLRLVWVAVLGDAESDGSGGEGALQLAQCWRGVLRVLVGASLRCTRLACAATRSFCSNARCGASGM